MSAIRSITAYQHTTETRWHIDGNIFIDCTGNGTLGYLAGAEYRTGSECKAEFNEPDAPENEDLSSPNAITYSFP